MISKKKLEAMKYLKKEFDQLQRDPILSLGCTVGLPNPSNIFKWKLSLLGPQDTPYAGGMFFLSVDFPEGYPNVKPEIRFINKIYHLNVDNTGHLCLTSTNEWHVSGKVKGNFYTVKQALFDVFCLFHHQGADSAYDEKMAQTYLQNPEEFNKVAKEWTKLYA